MKYFADMLILFDLRQYQMLLFSIYVQGMLVFEVPVGILPIASVILRYGT